MGQLNEDLIKSCEDLIKWHKNAIFDQSLEPIMIQIENLVSIYQLRKSCSYTRSMIQIAKWEDGVSGLRLDYGIIEKHWGQKAFDDIDDYGSYLIEFQTPYYEKFKNKRIERNISIKELSKLANVDYSEVVALEAIYQKVSIHSAIKIGKVLGLEVNEDF